MRAAEFVTLFGLPGPRFSLNFLSGGLDPRITFARTGATATRVNASGLIEAVAADTARFDYSPASLAARGLLIEEERINIALQSNFAATWTGSNASLSTNAATSPDGTANAAKIVEAATSAAHFVTQGVTSAAVTRTFSVYAKQAERTWIIVANNSVAACNAFFNLNTGVMGTVSAGCTAKIADAGNGYWRCEITFTANNGTNNCAVFVTTGDAVFSHAGDGTSGVYVYGGQVEAGAFSTSLIPTTTAAVTRAADLATITGSNFSDWWDAGAGTLAVQATPQIITGVRPLVQFDDTTSNEIITLRGNVADPELYIVDGGAAQAQIDAGTVVAGTSYKLAGAWELNNAAASLNGAAVVTDGAATMPTVTQARLGSDGTNYLNGRVQSIKYWPRRIPDPVLQRLSR